MLKNAVPPPSRGFAARLQLGIFMLTLSAGAATAADEIEFDLDQARWVDRILVVAANSAQQRDLLAMTEEVEAHACEFANRDLRLLLVIAASTLRLDGKAVEAQSAAGIIARLVPGAEEFSMRLIGKDGAVKQRWGSAVPAQEIFAVIDGMPMRRGESSADTRCH